MADEIIKCTVMVSDIDPDTGAVGGSITRDQDLFTDNLGKLLASWFKPQVEAIDPYTASFVSISGTTESCRIYYSSPGASQWNYYGAVATSGTGITLGVGTGSGTPTRADFNLQAQVGSWVGITASSVWVSTSGMLSFNADIMVPTEQVDASGTAIKECGAVIDMNTIGGVTRKFMIMRDSFGATPVDVRSGHYARVSYIIGV